MSITPFEGELPEYRSTLYNAGCFFDTMSEDTVLIIDLNFEEMEYHY